MVYVKKNKEKIKYICPNCLKDFNNRKSDYIRHINKLIKCEKNNKNENNNDNKDNNDNNDNNKLLDSANNNMTLDFNSITKNNISLVNDKETNNIIYDISFDEEETKDRNIHHDDNLIYEMIKKIDLLIYEINELKKDNTLLKKQIITNNTQNNIQNNCVNLNIHINNFNDTNDFKGNFNNLLKETGKFIYLKTVENMFLNPEKPENHNIYVADKNRGYAKIYNDGRWQTQNINIIDTIINKVVEYYKLSIEEIKRDLI